MFYFDESYYIQSKIKQLKDKGYGDFTADAVLKAMAGSGMTPQEHYLSSGRAEGLNPNPYFNEKEYLTAKAGQLNSIEFGGRTDWTAGEVLEGIMKAGFSCPAEHYERCGAFETDKDGNFINPSNAFDANAYWSAKLLQVRTGGYTVDGKTGNDITLDDVVAAFRNSELSPVSHYMNHGADEANDTGIAYVQTVPVGQRMPNDPYRENLGETVPGNYAANTRPPSKTTPKAAPNPADVGGLADEGVSPKPVIPAYNYPVPGDDDYVPLPSNIVGGNKGVTIIPPSTSGTGNVSDNFLVVDLDTGKGTVVGPDGAIKGQVDVDVTEDGDGITVTLPPASNVDTDTLPPITEDDLPPGVSVNPGLGNNFQEDVPPVPDTSGITAAVADGNLTVKDTVHSSGKSSITLDADGKVSDWTGSKTGAEKPADPLLDGKSIDASAVTGSGLLTIDSGAFADAHTVTGSKTAKNAIVMGKNVTKATGGAGDDTFTVHADHAVPYNPALNLGTVIELGGSGAGGDAVTLANGGSGGVSLLAVNGTDGNDKVTLTGSDARKLFVATLNLNGGADTVAIGRNGVVNELKAGTGSAGVTVEQGGRVEIFSSDGAAVTAHIDGTATTVNLSGGNDAVTVRDGGRVSQAGGNAVILGAGNDTLTVDKGGLVKGDIIGAGDNDTITIHGLVTGDVFGDASAASYSGNDRITVAAGGKVTGDIYTGNGEDTVIIENGATVRDLHCFGTGKKTIQVHGGATCGGIYGGDGTEDTLKITGAFAGTLPQFIDIEILDLSDAAAQRVTLDTATMQSLPSGAKVTGNNGDMVTFTGLTSSGKVNSLDDVKNAQYNWFLDGNTLHYKTDAGGTNVKTVTFNGAGYQTYRADGPVAWCFSSDAAPGLDSPVLSGGSLTLTGDSHYSQAARIMVGAGGGYQISGIGNFGIDSTTGNFSGSIVDAGAVGGAGDVTINTSTYEGRHSVVGSKVTDNKVTLGEYATAYTGGSGTDTITLMGAISIYLGGSSGGEDTVTNGRQDSSTININTITGSEAAYDLNQKVRIGAALDVTEIRFGAGNDTVTLGGIDGFPASAISIKTGGGNDTIILEQYSFAQTIEAGTGADRISMHESVYSTIMQNKGDSGAFALHMADSANTVSTANFDVVSTKGSKVHVAGFDNRSAWAGDPSQLPDFKTLPQNNGAVFVQGRYDQATDSFTAASNGQDMMLLYDSDAGDGVSIEAIVAVGVNKCGLNADGSLALNA